MTCADSPAFVWTDKHPDAIEDYGVDFTSYLTRWRESSKGYSLTTRVRARSKPGYEYECTTAGQTGLKEPLWPTTIAATVADGSVVWTCRALSTDSLNTTVSSVTWDADAAITITSETLTGQLAAAFLAGGADGVDYPVTITATLANGAEVPKVCILPIRIPIRNACEC